MLAGQTSPAEGDIAAAMDLACTLSGSAPTIGHNSWPVLSALATIGSVDLTTARAIEPHLDALAILHQAQATALPPPARDARSTWGVYAARPPGAHTAATGPQADGTWLLHGPKQWCSLADRLSHALITASADDDEQRLFAVSLQDSGVRVEMSQWNAHGLADIRTGTVHFDGATAYPIGPSGWYLRRPGFAWGGIAVAAVWFGAAAALAGSLWAAANRIPPDQMALMHLGRCDVALYTALLTLRHAATEMDDPNTTYDEASLLAARTRACVAEVAEGALTTVGHALGPGPLAFDERHSRRVADLTLYLRQHHAERDLARLGSLVSTSFNEPDGSAS